LANELKLVGVVPAFNEAHVLDSTVKGLHRIPELGEVWVVDDGSTDETARVAREAGAEVTRLPRNRGKGAALNHAFRAIEADVYLVVDADLGEQVQHLRSLLVPVLTGRADMAIAGFDRSRRRVRAGGLGVVMGIARAGIRWLTGARVAEPLSGQRVLTRRVIETASPLAKGFGVEVALTVDALRAGLQVVEVSTPLFHDGEGRSLAGFVHRGRQFFHVAQALLKRIVS
jgi:glycosyltransferase involved in cell wall biosynthesis